MTRCDTQGCYRDADYLMTADTDADGEILPEGEGTERRFCEPCKRAADWIQAWHPGDYSFVPLLNGASSNDSE